MYNICRYSHALRALSSFLDVTETTTNRSVVSFLDLHSHWTILVRDTLVIPKCAVVSALIALEPCIILDIFCILDILEVQ